MARKNGAAGLPANKSFPTISIIIPVHNGDKWIADALASCLDQRYAPFEVIVIDDGSTDCTCSVVRSCIEANADSPIEIVRTANKGASAARNRGLERATGEYVLFLDADDLLVKGALEALGGVAQKTGVDSVFGSYCRFDEKGQERPWSLKLPYVDSYANIARCLWFQGAALLRKTDLRWNERREIWEGMEYLLDFLTEAHTAAYLGSTIVKVRQHNDPNRMSRRFDHFEPGLTGRFFAEQKIKLTNCNRLKFERASALDYWILTNAYGLMKEHRWKEADALFAEISWENIAAYDWYHAGSLGWAGRIGGRRLGTKAFFYVNKLLQRV
jgi:glycosyltransferase involved in cell wall biosynthesis